MNLLIFEYFISGGRLNNQCTPQFLNEGQQLLSSILNSFTNRYNLKTITSVNKQIISSITGSLEKIIPADKVRITENFKSTPEWFKNLLWNVDATIIIAPETDNILFQLTKIAEKSGVKVLSSTSTAVKKAGNKWSSYNILKDAGYPQPLTVLASKKVDWQSQLNNFNHSLIIKPADGAGSDISLKTSKSNFLACNTDIYNCDDTGSLKDKQLIIQEYHQGIPASISALSNGQTATPLSLNKQLLSEKDLKYKGGIIGINHPLKQDILEKIKKLPDLFPGLRGYFGVDLLLKENDYKFIEINPRLTSSIIGLVPKINLGDLIIQAVYEKILPYNPETPFNKKFII